MLPPPENSVSSTAKLFRKKTIRNTGCYDRKARKASAQSFTLLQQATIEITRHDHFVIACSRNAYMDVVLRAHSVCGEPRIQRNANRKVATTSPPFYNEPHRSHVLFL